MSRSKKGALHQVLFVLVDKTDFATLESAITASDLNSKIGNGSAIAKFIGCDTGGSGATTSGTLSKAISQVRSHVFKAILKTTENNYDHMMLRVKHPSTAEQIVVWENVNNDDSDIMSALTVIQSAASDAASAATQANSRILLVQSNVSDVESQLDLVPIAISASDMSDLVSRVWSAKYTAHSAASSFGSLMSDIFSRVALAQSTISDVDSQLDITASKVVLIQSNVSDVESQLDLVPLAVSASDMSDIVSRVWSAKYTAHSVASSFGSLMSDIYSRAGGAVTASDISDIASAVKVALASDLSDILSAAVQTNSRVLVTQSLVSDVDSQLTINASRITLIQSNVSDVESQIDAGVPLDASTLSDLRSAITLGPTDVQLNASSLSDLRSAITATQNILASSISDIESQLDVTHSLLSDVESQLDKTANDVWAINLSQVTGAAARSPLNAIRSLRNKASTSGGVFNVFQEDDATKAWSAAITTSASIDHIVTVDP